MIVVVGGIKGGSGKTTLATNLAVIRSRKGKTLLVDADEQKSAFDWAQQRDGMGIQTDWSTICLSGRTMHVQIERLKPNYDDIIVDVGGRETTSLRAALAIADVFLTPFKPRSLDIWTLGPLKAMISEMKVVNPKLICIAAINQADAQGKDNHEAMEILKKCPDLVCFPGQIGNRKIFGTAASDGLGIDEFLKPDTKASQEMNDLHEYVFCTQL